MIDFRNVPQKLKDINSWVVWYKGVYQEHLKKNPVGVPIEAWSADWNTYPVKPYLEAKESLKQYRKENPTIDYGLGFALNMQHNVVGIDLDSVLQSDGTSFPVSQEYVMPIVEQARKDGCYMEYSVSNTGVHIYGTSKHKSDLFTLDQLGVIYSYFVEIYYAVSHLVVTGDALSFTDELNCIDNTIDVAMEQIKKIKKDFYLEERKNDKIPILIGYSENYNLLPKFQQCIL